GHDRILTPAVAVGLELLVKIAFVLAGDDRELGILGYTAFAVTAGTDLDLVLHPVLVVRCGVLFLRPDRVTRGNEYQKQKCCQNTMHVSYPVAYAGHCGQDCDRNAARSRYNCS